MDTTRASRLESVPLLRALPPDRLIHVLRQTESAIFTRGALLLRAHDVPDRLIFITAGHAANEVPDARKGNAIITLAGPGHLLGAEGLLGRTSNTAARAIGPVYADVIPAHCLLPFIQSIPAFSEQVAQLLADQTKEVTRVAADLLVLDAGGRLAARLCTIAKHHDHRRGAALELPRAISHGILAAATGVSRETITRTFKEFRHAGWLRSSSGQPDLIDFAALKVRAGAQPVRPDRQWNRS